ncbi:hypothetical protein X740_33305 [Mesorhizobium sp. LNHC221B00]|uniref:hypothetical protein n=1 Tax=Mesorhizobium sp. LNHC221B00 TaxID=1287233 RepID=UPI0003CDF542|nr:hypothetical protein [Mesorhizobium sp. LNHC221B00]ESY72328.1 hypothetical protein X740_33305 [Mesorhizobium sp. LNHC221B00]
MQSPGPFDPLTLRQELISELEGCGFDVGHGANANWRDDLSDDELRAAIARLNSEAA